MKNIHGFASDNNSGIHPDILAAVEKANAGHVIAYGDDPYTENAKKVIRQHFGECDIFFVLTGTGANVMGLSAVTSPYHSIICAETAHINEDECGAPERFSGCKLIPVETKNGKLTPVSVARHLHGFGFEHHSQPKVISISQSSELGTVYTPEEIRELADFAHKYNMLLHMDGARLSNAAVSLGLDFKSVTSDAGVDVLSFGGTKNGMLFGESVIFFNKGLSENFKYIRKQAMQLASKMRFVSVQFEAYLSNDLWKRNASHSNKMAQMLFAEASKIKGITVTQKVESNAVFAIIPKESVTRLQQQYFFYIWDEKRSEVRWMTSFDTTEKDIMNFVSLLKKIIAPI
ncbi:MAG TPA: low specificity L-threonine aldolase [Bacteroidales bacterium]|nr:low specificity L-threonine aldolase [Bacteroidales bacterium]